MSLSDYIKYMRAVKGGLTPWEIAEGSGVPAREIHLLEVKHRRVGENDDALKKLAEYFGLPLEELAMRRDAYRKRLTAFLEENQSGASVISLKLESGEQVSGTVEWFGREAVALTPKRRGGHPYIVQRSWVADWRRENDTVWQVAEAEWTPAPEDQH